MKNSSSEPKPREPASADPDRGIDFGWRVHAATQDWIRNVDQKASIVLAIIVAVSGFAVVQVFSPDGSLYAVEDGSLQQWAIRLLPVALIVAGAAALGAVFPSLKRKRAREMAATGLIFFGHLRHRDATDIEGKLERLRPEDVRHQLAMQLEATSEIAWKKHALLQSAQAALALAIVAFIVALIC